MTTLLDPIPAETSVDSLLHEDCNQNLTRPQKDLLHWHWRLGHASQRRVQSLMRKHPVTCKQVIVPRERKAASCDHPMCTACHLTKATRNQAHLPPRQPAPIMAIRQSDLRPGDCVSVDQYVCPIRGRLPHTRGKKKDLKRFSGGLIQVNNQVSLYGGETLCSKNKFETFLSRFGVKTKKYYCDNGIFAAESWTNDCESKQQENEFSAVGAHHQNGVAERSIQTIAYWAREMMLHVALHWPNKADIKLWPFAMQHAAHIWNHLSDESSGIAPNELLSGSTLPSFDCLRLLGFTCLGMPCLCPRSGSSRWKETPEMNPSVSYRYVFMSCAGLCIHSGPYPQYEYGFN